MIYSQIAHSLWGTIIYHLPLVLGKYKWRMNAYPLINSYGNLLRVAYLSRRNDQRPPPQVMMQFRRFFSLVAFFGYVLHPRLRLFPAD